MNKRHIYAGVDPAKKSFTLAATTDPLEIEEMAERVKERLTSGLGNYANQLLTEILSDNDPYSQKFTVGGLTSGESVALMKEEEEEESPRPAYVDNLLDPDTGLFRIDYERGLQSGDLTAETESTTTRYESDRNLFVKVRGRDFNDRHLADLARAGATWIDYSPAPVKMFQTSGDYFGSRGDITAIRTSDIPTVAEGARIEDGWHINFNGDMQYEVTLVGGGYDDAVMARAGRF